MGQRLRTAYIAGPKGVVKVLLKRCHQHHLAADHLVWTACAEVGLKKDNYENIFLVFGQGVGAAGEGVGITHSRS